MDSVSIELNFSYIKLPLQGSGCRRNELDLMMPHCELLSALDKFSDVVKPNKKKLTTQISASLVRIVVQHVFVSLCADLEIR